MGQIFSGNRFQFHDTQAPEIETCPWTFAQEGAGVGTTSIGPTTLCVSNPPRRSLEKFYDISGQLRQVPNQGQYSGARGLRKPQEIEKKVLQERQIQPLVR